MPVSADTVNEIALPEAAPAGYVRLSIHPDGGVARFRTMGRAHAKAAGRLRVTYLNSLFTREARQFFVTACASSTWVEGMVAARPHHSPEAVLEAASTRFDALTDDDWLEAFAGHPRIGERGDSAANKEQSGVTSASRDVIARLAAVNEEYEEKFGFTYIVYATGKTAEQMLEIAEQRLANTRREEIDNAAREQRSITGTRLRRMLCQENQ